MKDVCIVRPNVDRVADRHRARERKRNGRDRIPFTFRSTAAERAPVYDSKGASMRIGRKRFHCPTGQFLMTSVTRKDDQPIAPRRGKYGRVSHRSTVLLWALRAA